jgi:hypothetical protein
VAVGRALALGVPVSNGCGVGLRRGQDAAPGGPQAGEADRREEAAGAGSLPVDGPQAAGDQPDDPPSLRAGQGGGAQADGRDGRVERSVKEACRLGVVAAGPAGGGAKAKLKVAGAMAEMADRCEKVARQVRPHRYLRPVRMVGRSPIGSWRW